MNAKRKRPEGDFNDDLRVALAGLDPCRVENAVGPGTPDINFLGGWIESKSIPAFPKRDTTVVALDHYTNTQRGWHVRRRMAGGVVLVALRVQQTRETFAFDALEAAQHLGVHWTANDLRINAALWLKCWNVDEFRTWLAKGAYNARA